MSLLTLITALVVGYGVVSGYYGRALALGGATAAGAAVVAGGTAVPTFYAVALGTPVALVLSVLTRHRRPHHDPLDRSLLPPGASLLIVFFGWAVLVTLVAPLLFNGLSIVTPTTRSLVAGVITSSNVAQIIYLFLGVCVFVFLARARRAGPEIIGLLVGTATILSLWRYLNDFGVPFPVDVFDNSPTFAYIETAPNNVQRFRGIFSEPSGLAGSCLVTVAYMLSRAVHVSGGRRIGALALTAVAIYLGIISTSATFVVAGVAVGVIVLASSAFGFLMRWTRFSALVSVVCCALVVGAIWLLPIIADFVQLVVNEKLASASYNERSGADTDSYAVFFNTFGLGVGVGAGRASSFFPTLLSTTGLIGVLLFAATIALLIFRSASITRYRPVVWSLVAALVLKVVAGPDLSDSTGVQWIAMGLLSRAILQHADTGGGDPSVQPATALDPLAPTAVSRSAPSARSLRALGPQDRV